ncbi:MAG: twin-arginine translocase TatA/TatE family subunit [Solirubrobacterales bacterium]|nr:twin-arginine translocase TatA/TatE family subunit [Solirubrobacterales bacterium]
MVGLDNPIHLAFLLVILLLVFGAKRLPEMGRSLGSGLRGFKESVSGEAHTDPQAVLSAAHAEPATGRDTGHVERVERVERPVA